MTGIDHIRNRQRERNSNRRRHEIEPERFAPDSPERSQITQCGYTANERDEHQWNHHKLEQRDEDRAEDIEGPIDEEITDSLEISAEGVDKHTDEDAGQHGEKYSLRKSHQKPPGPSVALASPAKTSVSGDQTQTAGTANHINSAIRAESS